jgi:hypothetical protein
MEFSLPKFRAQLLKPEAGKCELVPPRGLAEGPTCKNLGFSSRLGISHATPGCLPPGCRHGLSLPRK